MDSSAFSTVLFDKLCSDLGFHHIDSEARFDPSYQLRWNDLGPDEFARAALLRSIFKKSEVEVSHDAAELTMLSFLEANQACAEWEIPKDPKLSVGFSIAYARDALKNWFEPQCGTELELTMASIEREARFGPGASLGHGKVPHLFYFKVGDAPMFAASEYVRSWYNLSVQHNPLCEAAELARNAKHGPIQLAEFGNLTMVPKSHSKMRIVVTEPSANTYFQLGAGKVIERVLDKRTSTNLSTQPFFNAKMAEVGSRNGSYATVDMKQCSDYIALPLVKYMFPKSVTQWVNTLRTPAVKADGYGIIRLNMASTMGNGFTFPLQTALLLGVVYGVYKTLDIPFEPCTIDGLGTYGVFGDDVVVLRESFPLFVQTVEALGMIVNKDKSFCDGAFRESCGHDYFDGREVRGVYIRKYETPQDFISIFNRLIMWSSRHTCHLTETLSFLKEVIGDNFSLVPPDESVDSGIMCPLPSEYPNEEGLWSYTCFIPAPSSFQVEPWEEYEGLCSSQLRKGKWKRFIRAVESYCGGVINQPALLKALLYGGLRRGKLIFKANKPIRYRKVVKVTPRWGYTENPLCAEMRPETLVFWMNTLATVMMTKPVH